MYFKPPRAIVLLSLVLLCLLADARAPEPQIAGRVVRADNGLPIEGAAIELRPFVPEHGELQTAIADGHGDYQFLQGVEDGTYEIAASAEGFVSQTYRRDATPEGEFQRVGESTRLRGVDFRLKREARIRGVLTHATGEPAGAGISVIAVRKEKQENGPDQLRPSTWAKTDASGRFALTKLPSGTYFVCVNGPNGFGAIPDARGWYRETWYGSSRSAQEAIPVALQGGEERNDVRITVEREKRYRVIVWPFGPEGDPKPDSYDVTIEGRSHPYTQEANGSYVIPGVPVGHYRLIGIAWSDAGYLGEGDMGFEVTDADVTLHLPVGGLGEIQGIVKPDETPGKVPTGTGLRIGIESQEGAAQGRDVNAGHFLFGRVLPGRYKFKLLKKPPGAVLLGVHCGGAQVTPDSPLRVGDRQKVADCEVLVGRDPAPE
jgi:hypothetical protein